MKNWLGIEIKVDEYGREYFYWKDTKARIYGGVISGDAVEYIVSHLQYMITINLTNLSAQIGCYHKTIAEWLDVSLEDALEMGLEEKNYEPIRNLLRKFA